MNSASKPNAAEDAAARYVAAADHLLRHCGDLAAGERVTILCDDDTWDIAELVAGRAHRMTDRVQLLGVPIAQMHGTEPPAEIGAHLLEQDLIVGLTFTSLAHTRARQEACARGARYLSLPEYSWTLLSDPAVMADFRGRAPVVRRFADAFTSGSRLRVTTRAGTDIRLDMTGRIGNYCPGYVSEPGSLGSPPDIEANISPLETRSEGVIVVDGSVPCRAVGLLSQPVAIEVKDGRVGKITGADQKAVARIKEIFATVGSEKAYVVAECGVGLNEHATLTGTMLTDEGTHGCVHFGIGSNATVGGINDVAFHLDFVCRDAVVEIDGKVVLKNGELFL